MQTKKDSFKEALQNIAIGYCIAVSAQHFIYPLVGVTVSFSSNLKIGLGMTIVSIVRQYCIRRYNNLKAELIQAGFTPNLYKIIRYYVSPTRREKINNVST